MSPVRDWLIAYRLAMDLPDEQVRRARLEGLDQALVDGFWDQGFLLACPRVDVRFEDGSPQGHIRAGARAERPGLLIMRSDSRGRVRGAASHISSPEGDAAVIHRWSVLLHEAVHFSFEQLPSACLVEAMPSGWEDLQAPLAQHLWAPFLSNLERTRLNESVADGCSSALLLGWASALPGVKDELDLLASLRQEGHAQHLRSGSSTPWRHGPAATIRRVLADPIWGPGMRPDVLWRQGLRHSVGGVVDRWSEEPASLSRVEASWFSIQLERVCEAFLHARRHHDTGMVERWLTDHPDHPFMKVAQALRWQAPVSEHAPVRPWHEAWEQAVVPLLPVINQAWDQVGSSLREHWAPPSRPRLGRPR